MPTISRICATIVTVLLLQVFGARPASAVIRDRSWSFDGFFTGAILDNDSNTDDAFGAGFHAGYFFVENHGIEFTMDGVFSEVKNNENLNVNLLTFKLGYLYTFAPKANFTPHLTIGTGIQNLTVYEDFCDCDCHDDWWWGGCGDTIIDETDPMAYAGIGMRAFIGPSFHLRA